MRFDKTTLMLLAFMVFAAFVAALSDLFSKDSNGAIWVLIFYGIVAVVFIVREIWIRNIRK